MDAIRRLEHAPTKHFYDDDQLPDRKEWTRARVWDGVKWVNYVRGKHGGWDLQAKGDTSLLAMVSGVVQHVDFGKSLGTRQFVIRLPDGSAWFYAHTTSRPADGDRVVAGDPVATMGNSGTTSVHLHLECLERWNDWHSTTNATAALVRLWEEGQPMTQAQMEELKKHISDTVALGIRDAVKALGWGENSDKSSVIPDTPAWKAAVGNNNIRKAIEKMDKGG